MYVSHFFQSDYLDQSAATQITSAGDVQLTNQPETMTINIGEYKILNIKNWYQIIWKNLHVQTEQITYCTFPISFNQMI